MNNFNLSEDLKELFKISFLILKDNNSYEVTIDCIVACILNRYLEERDNDIRRDEKLIEYFSSYTTEQKSSILDMVDEVMEEEYNRIKYTFSSALRNSVDEDSIVLSDTLNFLLKKLDARYNHESITAFDFLVQASLDENDSMIMYRLHNEYDITYDSLITFQMSKLISDTIGSIDINNIDKGELKEKRIQGEESYQNQQQKIENEDKEFEMAGNSGNNIDPVSDPNSTTPFLDKYSFNMTKAAKEGMYDNVIGREKEISQVIEILACRKKKNVIILADAGVGKSACVEGLAQMIVNDQVPMELKGREIRNIDLTSMVSGSIYRGEYEAKIQGVIKELEQNPHIIGFIDEIHNLVGNGSSTQNNDGANILKPSLARGSITLIGSTTYAEYHKFIEKDSALKRRFQTVVLTEPGIDETVEILNGISQRYSEFHKVKYTPEVIKACVEWSARYINDRYFPDKAIDILDISSSLTKLSRTFNISAIENIENSIEAVVKEKIELVGKCEFEEAQKRRDTESMLREELRKEKEKLNQEINNPDNWPEVTIDNVASVISKVSKIPVDKIRETTVDKLRSMKSAMESRVIGQEEAIKKVFMSLSRQFMGFRDYNRPVSLLFVGKTAVGKTELAKVIADEVFAGEKSLIRINGGDLIERGSVSKLIGASASYIGYDDEPLLLQVKRHPFSVLLIDEVEKMSEEILNTVFLPILDEGKITLANNEEVSFKNQIIIMTSNLGVKELSNKTNLGFGKVTKESDEKENEEIILKAIKKKFKPEMLNRISGGIIYFNSLGTDELLQIFDLELKKLQKRTREKGFTITVTDEMKRFIVSKCDLQYGARDLQREMSKYIEESVIDAMMSQENNCGKDIVVDLDESKESPVVTFNTTITVNIEKNQEMV